MGGDGGGICPLCRRPMPPGSYSSHHLVPKSRKGRETVDLHHICHRKIHSLFSDKELAERYYSIELLCAHPEIEKFVRWVAKRPPGFYSKTVGKKR